VVGLTKAAALEYATSGIRVNCVCPSVIRTPMIAQGLSHPERLERILAILPIGRVGEPEEVAEAVVWLCLDAASFVTGHTMTVDGGVWRNRQQTWSVSQRTDMGIVQDEAIHSQ
jgi:NAD(P)-dependent dehydrogenase (short-subunit alcohol dehydrogenase family)